MVQVSHQCDASNSSKLSKYLEFNDNDVENTPCLHTLNEETDPGTSHHLDETLIDQDEVLFPPQTTSPPKDDARLLASYLNRSKDSSLSEFSRSKQLLEETLFEHHVHDNDTTVGDQHLLDETLAELEKMPSFDQSLALYETLVPLEQREQSAEQDDGTLGPMYEYYRRDLPSQIPEVLFFLNHDGNCDLMADCLNELAYALLSCPEPTSQAVLALGVMSSIRKRVNEKDREQNVQALRVILGYCRAMKGGKDIPHLIEQAIATSRRFPTYHTIVHLTVRILSQTMPTATAEDWFPRPVTLKAITHAAEIIEQWTTDLRLQQNAVEFLMEATRFQSVTQRTFEKAGAIATLQSHIERLTNKKGSALKDSRRTLEVILSLP